MSFSSVDRAGRGLTVLGPLAILLATLAALPVFWLGLESLGLAWITPEYSHGPLIPVISFYLFLRELRNHPDTPGGSGGIMEILPGLGVAVLALGLAVVGNIMGVPDIVAYALILWVMALVLIAMGWTRGRRHWAPVLHLVFMLPLPQIVYWNVSTWLQGVSAEVGVAMIGLMGIPVLLEGHVIDLGVYKLQVAEACSGLRYLFPILSFSYLTAILYRGPFAHKLVLFAMAAPVAVLLNALRIGIIGILVDSYGIAQAEGFLHVFEGWVVFGLCLVVLFSTAWLLSCLRRTDGPMLDLDTTGLAAELGRVRGVGNVPVILVLAALSTAGSTTILARSAQEPVIARPAFALLDLEMGRWSGARATLDPQVARVLGADDYLDATLVGVGESAPVQTFVAWYANQNGGSGLHSPTVCLPSAGWEIAEMKKIEIALDGGFTANRALISKGLEQQLVYYWFEQGGTRVTGDWQAKLLALRRSLFDGVGDGAIVRFTTPVISGEEISMADRRILDMMAEALPRLAAHLPR
ncbi:MAG: VPLPA-CTERM-specific exosortase XrtD [Jannaschia sp.]